MKGAFGLSKISNSGGQKNTQDVYSRVFADIRNGYKVLRSRS